MLIVPREPCFRPLMFIGTLDRCVIPRTREMLGLVLNKKNPFVGLFYRTESKLIEGQKVKGQVGANFMHELMAICEYTEHQNCSVELSLFPSLILDFDQ